MAGRVGATASLIVLVLVCQQLGSSGVQFRGTPTRGGRKGADGAWTADWLSSLGHGARSGPTTRQHRPLVWRVLRGRSLQQKRALSPSGKLKKPKPPAPQYKYERGVRKKCSDNCYQLGTCNEELGRCDCPKDRLGNDCERPSTPARMAPFVQPEHREAAAPLTCVNSCNGRGRCELGECICERGFWGADCSLSLDESNRPVILAGRGYVPRERGPKIYIYDLPHKYSSWFHPARTDRGTHWFLLERLLGSGAVVADGEEADWYFIPCKLRTTGDGYKLLEIIKKVQTVWPWYNRLHGHRHFIVHVGDAGRGEVPQTVRDATANMTWLHHWGLTQDFPYAGWKTAHRPGKDIVIPIAFPPGHGKGFVATSGLHPRAPRMMRDQGMLLFVGRICGDMSKPKPNKAWPHCATEKSKGYSQGARQLVHFHHHNRTGYKIVTGESPDTYLIDLLSYRFCLAPSGGGHGHRQALAVLMGCIPVVVSDYVMQPFEPELDWTQFSIRVAHKDVPSMHTVLAALAGDVPRMARMRAAMACAAEHMAYSSIVGSFMRESGKYDAFEMILELLRMQQLYPGLDPTQYGAKDERFRSFLYCGGKDLVSYGEQLQAQIEAQYPMTIADEAYGKGKATWARLYKTGMHHMLVRATAFAAAATNNGNDKGRSNGTASAEGVTDAEAEAEVEVGVEVGEDGEMASETRRLHQQRAGVLPVCSMSLWDPPNWRCSAYLGKESGPGKRPLRGGGAVCDSSRANVAQCPRLWP